MRDLKVLIIGDTHILSPHDLPSKIVEEVKHSDWLIHAGDYISERVLNLLLNLKGNRFIGVFGNADPLSIRKKLPIKTIFELNGVIFGLTHPSYGGPEESILNKILKDFVNDKIDVLIFGHIHNPKIEKKEGILILNPGKGYFEKSFFGAPTSYIILCINQNRKIKADLRYITEV
ncbi:MAG: metallophosphoesterase family protein [Promethearchaeati archaeon]